MRHWIRARLTYANVMVTILAFLVLGGGTAVALDGSNTVFSDDIVNGEVQNADIGTSEVKANSVAPDSLGGGKITDRSVKNADLGLGASSSNTIADGGIQGIDVKNDSLTGTQIDESTLNGGNADTLDGKDSTEFVQGGGRLLSNRSVALNNQTVFALDVPGFFQIFLACDADGSGFNNIAYRSESSEDLEVFFDNGSGNPERRAIAGGDTTTFSNSATPAGELNIVQVSAPSGKVLTAWVTSASRGSDCIVNAQGTLTAP
jgi:hypothetical protein